MWVQCLWFLRRDVLITQTTFAYSNIAGESSVSHFKVNRLTYNINFISPLNIWKSMWQTHFSDCKCLSNPKDELEYKISISCAYLWQLVCFQHTSFFFNYTFLIHILQRVRNYYHSLTFWIQFYILDLIQTSSFCIFTRSIHVLPCESNALYSIWIFYPLYAGALEISSHCWNQLPNPSGGVHI